MYLLYYPYLPDDCSSGILYSLLLPSPTNRWYSADGLLQLEFLPPYSRDFNPIKKQFGVLKEIIRKKRYENEDFIIREFNMFLEWYVDLVTFVMQGYQLHKPPNKYKYNKIELGNILSYFKTKVTFLFSHLRTKLRNIDSLNYGLRKW